VRNTTGIASPYLIHHTRNHGNAPRGSQVFVDRMSHAFAEARDLAGIGGEHPPTFHEIRSLTKRLYEVQGNVDTFLGFKFIQCERLGVDGSGDRRCIAWAKSGMHLGMWNDINTKISERADKSYATQVYVKGTFGATRTDEKKVVEIICNL